MTHNREAGMSIICREGCRQEILARVAVAALSLNAINLGRVFLFLFFLFSFIIFSKMIILPYIRTFKFYLKDILKLPDHKI